MQFLAQKEPDARAGLCSGIKKGDRFIFGFISKK